MIQARATKLPIQSSIGILFPLAVASTVFGLTSMPLLPMSVHKVTLIFIMFLMALSLLAGKRVRFSVTSPSLLLVWAFLAFCLVSALFSINPGVSVGRLIDLGQYAMVALITFLFINRFWKERQLPIMMLILEVAALASALTIISDFFGVTSFSSFWRHYGILGGSNVAAAQLAIFLPAALYGLTSRWQTRFTAWWHLAAVMVILLALFLTGSRAGYIMGATVMLPFMLWQGWRLINLKTIAATLVLVAAVFLLAPGQLSGRLESFGSSAVKRSRALVAFLITDEDVPGNSLERRLKMTETSVGVFSEHYLTGVGVGNFLNYHEPFTGLNLRAHNTFLEILAETGLFGFVVFVLLFVKIALNLLRAALLRRHEAYGYLLMAFLAMTAFQATQSLQFRGWYLWGLFIPLSLYLEHRFPHASNKEA